MNGVTPSAIIESSPARVQVDVAGTTVLQKRWIAVCPLDCGFTRGPYISPGWAIHLAGAHFCPKALVPVPGT